MAGLVDPITTHATPASPDSLVRLKKPPLFSRTSDTLESMKDEDATTRAGQKRKRDEETSPKERAQKRAKSQKEPEHFTFSSLHIFLSSCDFSPEDEYHPFLHNLGGIYQDWLAKHTLLIERKEALLAIANKTNTKEAERVVRRLKRCITALLEFREALHTAFANVILTPQSQEIAKDISPQRLYVKVEHRLLLLNHDIFSALNELAAFDEEFTKPDIRFSKYAVKQWKVFSTHLGGLHERLSSCFSSLMSCLDPVNLYQSQ